MIHKSVFCPVGNHVALGYLVKGEVCSFVCKECGWIFSWDGKGKLMEPVKCDVNRPLKARRYCGPEGCVCR